MKQEIKVIFLDDGGVMNDNNLRFHQWRDLVGQYFSPRYGGTIQKWRQANTYALNQLLERYEKTVQKNPKIDFNNYWYKEQIQWLTNMFNHAKINPPPYEKRAIISRSATDWITPQVKAAFPGVVETIQLLRQRGFLLCTASGEVSWELKGYLKGMGILDCFERLYGPDLINVAKAGIAFYEKIFEEMKISQNSSTALVIDDSSKNLLWASKLGAKTVHVLNSSKCGDSTCHIHIDQLRELPQLLPEINDSF
ncbi:MAG: HAD family hydrolase [Candidatus Hodarchaeales archaeon]|jgi:HAD superfamily hydrolase (TIGR01509 family)